MALSETELHAFSAFEKDGWEKAADRYHRHWGRLSQQSAEPMLVAAGVTRGMRVLDVATGAGYVAAAAASLGAQAIGLDFSEAQVALARRVHPYVEFRQGRAEELPFATSSFDAVVIGFGLNHLPHPEKALDEAFRVLRSGGALAFTVWAQPKAGEGFGIVLNAIETYGVATAALPPAPPYFRFADPSEAKRACERAGFVSPGTRVVPQYWHHQSPDELFDAFHEGAVRATAMLRSQPAEARENIRSAVRTEVERLRVDDRFVISVPAALSWARKP